MGENAAIAGNVKEWQEAKAKLEGLLEGIKTTSGKLFSSGGGSSSSDEIKRIKDELAKLSMSEQQYNQLKLDEKYKELRKSAKGAASEIEKLYALEKIAVSNGMSGGDTLASKMNEVRKQIENWGLDAKQVQLKELEREFTALRESFKVTGADDSIFATLDKIYELKKQSVELGKDITNPMELLKDFEKEYQSVIKSSTGKMESIANEMNIYRAAVDAANLSLEERENILRRIDEIEEYKKLLEAKDSFSGMKRGYQTYAQDAGDAAKLAENFMTNSMSAMEDALFNFVQTGKMDFKSLADSIIADLMRISIRMAMFGQSGDGSGGLMGLITSGIGMAVNYFGGGGSGGGINFASGDSAGYYSDLFANTDWSTPIMSHSGSVIGQDSYQRKRVPTSVFDYAFRYHNGGLAGLRPDEVPAILQKGESVLTPAQARTLAPVNEIAQALKQALGGGSGVSGGMPKVTVNIQNYSKAEVETQESQDGQGGFSMDLIMRDVERGIAKNINNGNSPVGQALARNYQLDRAGALYNK
jgi:hypothetical protein